MKSFTLAGMLLLAANAYADLPEATNVETVEVPIQYVFVPKVGYDDNDNVQIVLDGFLPNSCYTMAGNMAEPTRDPRVFRIRQFALAASAYFVEASRVPREFHEAFTETLNAVIEF